MKYLRFATLFLLALALFAAAADAQKTTKRYPVKKPVLPPLDVRVAREKVDTQLSNVNKFIDVLGPIAQSIETLDASAAAKTLPKSAIDKNEETKRKVIEAIRNLKVGLSDLETEFRTKPLLQKYLLSIKGITDLAAKSEDSAIAGKFVASKEPLRAVAQKLTDTLAVMPISPPL